MARSDANTQPAQDDVAVAVITDAGSSPAARMRDDLIAVARNNASFSSAGDMALAAANKMLAAESLDDILAAGQRAGLGAKDVLGKVLTYQYVEWAESSDRFEAPFGVFAIAHCTDASDAEITYTTGAGNLVSALRAMELGGHFPVTLRISSRTTGNGELYYFTR